MTIRFLQIDFFFWLIFFRISLRILAKCSGDTAAYVGYFWSSVLRFDKKNRSSFDGFGWFAVVISCLTWWSNGRDSYLYLSWFFCFAIFSEYLNTNLTILIFLNFTFLGFGLVFIKGKLFEIPLLAPAERNYEFFLIADHSLFLTL